ncbi:hypothetical protein [Candidatus Nanohalobium constans]|uniref:hypothetical protein n=1 Tax=Candidatus Nanohalobium constans TaxID=2565781 RepID=UPI001298518E|nr:hypothetical protein [Candidatus Nanohalobium constans]
MTCEKSAAAKSFLSKKLIGTNRKAKTKTDARNSGTKPEEATNKHIASKNVSSRPKFWFKLWIAAATADKRRPVKPNWITECRKPSWRETAAANPEYRNSRRRV